MIQTLIGVENVHPSNSVLDITSMQVITYVLIEHAITKGDQTTVADGWLNWYSCSDSKHSSPFSFINFS